jgi:hypothetical protein
MEKIQTVTTETMLWIVSITLVMVTLTLSILYYNVHKDELMSKNIETAVSKGIDPLAVRCSYANNQDIVCIAYAASASTSPTSAPSLQSRK